jgi:hypothetical protein
MSSSSSSSTSHISYNSNDWEILLISESSDNSETSDSIDSELEDQVYAWLQNQPSPNRLAIERVSDIETIGAALVDMQLNNNIDNIGLVNIDTIYEMNLLELEDYNESLLLDVNIPSEMITIVNLHLLITNQLINYILGTH